jgi:hypothetical protein
VYYIVQQSASNEKEELSWLKKKEELRKGAVAAGNMGGDVAEGVVFLLQVGRGAATIPPR